MAAEIASLLLLLAVLAAAVARPWGIPEALVALPAAAVLVAAGAISVGDVRSEADRLFPILVFLAAVLVLAHVSASEGLFDAAGEWLARSSAGRGTRLLVLVFGLSVAITSVLSLDATVVLLTPVVLATATRVGIPARPHVYASGHLANSGSLLLPMANLSNLLALSASGLTLLGFAAAMALPLMAVLAVEFVVLNRYFRDDLRLRGNVPTDRVHTPDVPRVAVGVLVGTLAGFVIASLVGVQPFWVAVAGATALASHALFVRKTTVGAVLAAVDVQFLGFVFGLALVVSAVVDNGLGAWIDQVLPSGTSLVALLGFAAVAVVLANVVNNLPALLILVAPAAAVGPTAVLAVLIGVNVGPNLTYTGSLATLLWRRVLGARDLTPDLRRFTVLGLLTVPAAVVLATAALWLTAQVLPGL